MQLTTIELVGFKSFADKTLIELKGGTTAIVGPNGCGKSNIVDALRWCLGEMSAKSLRSKQMLDVIFAGSAGRPALNLSEVTLTFDNSHHLLPIDFTEVQVTRRLFRSGESEYFLNKTQCRLKDIRDLFMDTGVAEGYSILAQGEVDFVLNAKPEERRELFEEAAGISKYKARREEALHKLEKVENDLSRLNDIITMVKEQMDSLENAAKKAKTYQKIKEDLKNLEIADSVQQVRRLDEQIRSTQAKMEELQAEIQKSTAELAGAEALWTQVRFEQDECEKKFYKLNSSVLELEKQIDTSDHTLRLAQEREQEFLEKEKKSSEQIRQSENELVIIQNKLADAEKEIDETRAAIRSVRESFATDKEAWNALEACRKALEGEKGRVSEVLFQAAGETNELKNDQNRCNSLLLRQEVETATNERELGQRREEEGRLGREMETLRQSLAAFSEARATQEKEISDLRASEAGQQAKEKELAERSVLLQHTLIQRETQLDALHQNLLGNPYTKGTQSVLKEGFPGLRGVVGLLLKYPPHMAAWIETALGSRVNHLVFDHLEEAQQALTWLKENNLGRAVCIILDRIPSAPAPDLSSIPNGNSLLAFTQCGAELEPLRKYLLGQAFLSGNTLYDHGTVDGGSDPAVQNAETQGGQGSFANQNQFLLKDRLGGDITQAKAESALVEQALAEARAELARLKAALAEKESALAKTRVQENHTDELLRAKGEEADLCRREIAVLNDKKVQAEAESARVSTALEAAQAKLAAVEEAVRGREREREVLEQKISEKRNEEHQAEILVKESAVRLESSELHLNKSESALAEWKHRLEEYQKSVADLTQEIERCRTQTEQVRQTQKDEAAKIQGLQQEKARITLEIEELMQTKNDLEQKARECEAALQSLREVQKQLSENAHQTELELRSFESDKKNVLRRVEESYQMTADQVQELSLQPPQETVSAEELARLRKRVESMSNSVNLEAPEQYQALSERFNFLSSQTGDLQKAKDDLKSTIQQINASTKEQFRETFFKVRENFQMIYSHLFSGGVADLVFTDEHNLLETGIDIVAQPPGKKPQSIHLLSGGEKTLTATALLFAFFMVKPSPFCVLDEVDAPLDPANVGRFLNLLKDFANKTQFLVVTHNPRTMEAADILYGVTMEESGVSKVLSARLRKEASQSTVELTTA